MIFSTLLSFAILSASALASEPTNIDGLTGRLELARCEGAFALKLKAFEKFGETGICQDNEDVEVMAQCLKSELPKVASRRADAVFELEAIEGQRDFKARITSGGSEVFHSIRRGFHGDTEKGPTLGFYRVGAENGDPYQIDFAPLSNDGSRSPIAFVPVKRILLPDLIYIFVDGCTLGWEVR